jgi:hypothetical protein
VAGRGVSFPIIPGENSYPAYPEYYCPNKEERRIITIACGCVFFEMQMKHISKYVINKGEYDTGDAYKEKEFEFQSYFVIVLHFNPLGNGPGGSRPAHCADESSLPGIYPFSAEPAFSGSSDDLLFAIRAFPLRSVLVICDFRLNLVHAIVPPVYIFTR